jgi:hypothetical protein
MWRAAESCQAFGCFPLVNDFLLVGLPDHAASDVGWEAISPCNICGTDRGGFGIMWRIDMTQETISL